MTTGTLLSPLRFDASGPLRGEAPLTFLLLEVQGGQVPDLGVLGLGSLCFLPVEISKRTVPGSGRLLSCCRTGPGWGAGWAPVAPSLCPVGAGGRTQGWEGEGRP